VTVPPLTPEKEFRDFAMHGSVERMQEVYQREKSLDVNATELHSRRTALHKAAFFGHAHVIPYLLQRQAACNVPDVYGDTPLHDAAHLGHATVVAALLQGGADPQMKNHAGQTAWDMAHLNHKTKVMELLSAP
jgi:ankyrin repeat protein